MNVLETVLAYTAAAAVTALVLYLATEIARDRWLPRGLRIILPATMILGTTFVVVRLWRL